MFEKGNNAHRERGMAQLVNYMPPPSTFGLTNFPSWRDGQEDALAEALGTDKRFTALCLPTGAGKTIIYMTMAQMEEGRTAILTLTKPLQAQLTGDFPFLTDIRGKGNYKCQELQPGGEYFDPNSGQRDRYCDVGPCQYGYDCELKMRGCSYFDQLRVALGSKILLTNYAYWMSSYYFGEGLGDFDQLILDEAHSTPEALAGFFHTEISAADLAIATTAPPSTLDPMEWKAWARSVKLPKNGTRAIETLRSKLRRLLIMDEEWVVDDEDGFTFDPRTPALLASNLFQDVPKIVFVSATVRPKTCELLGVKDDLYFFEADSNFPMESRRITHIRSNPLLRITFRSTPADMRRWVNKADQYIDRRLDRKGILHTVSYKRARLFAENSRHKAHLITHGTRSTGEAIARFKAAVAPAILVSPATTTGYDFPGDECRYQIIGKIPFPDTTSKIMKVRCKDDEDLAMYLTMQDLVQTCGRPVRAKDDWSETGIIDDSAIWFIPKYSHFAPSYFLEGYRTVRMIPDPPGL